MVTMIGETAASILLSGVPLLGALVNLAFRPNPDQLKISSIATAVISLGAAAGLAGSLTSSSEGFLLIILLPLAAIASLLGQPVQLLYRSSWTMTLLFLGLGFGVLAQRGPAGQILSAVIMGLIAVLLYRHHTALWPMSWWGISTYGLAIVPAVLAAVTEPPISVVASLLSCAILLPLAPFHGGYVAALTRLPGNLPSFLAALLPIIGFHSLASSSTAIPDALTVPVAAAAIGGALYGAAKALAQSRVRLRLAYGSLSFFCILWWFTAATRGAGPSPVVFASAVALVTSGLLISWQVVRTRYGDDVDPQSISGLASAMPRYAVLLSLLGLAAIGLPPFGVFAGFFELVLAPTVSFSVVLFFILLVWLAASWYILDPVQRLLFRTRRPDLRHADLGHAEFASLILIVLALVVLGVVPAHLFGTGSTAHAEIGSLTWTK